MARYAHPLVLDNGPAHIQANCNLLVAVIAFSLGDSYATLTNPANVVASAAMAPADFTFTDSGSDRVLNNASKTDASADASGNPTHFAFLDTANSRILRVTEENTANAVAAGGSVTLPNIPYIVRQPVAVV